MIFPLGTRVIAVEVVTPHRKYIRIYGSGRYGGKQLPPRNFYLQNMPFDIFEEGLVRELREKGINEKEEDGIKVMQKSLDERFAEHVVYLDNGMTVYGYECEIIGPEKDILERFAGYTIDNRDINRQRREEMEERIRKQQEQERK